MNQALERIIAEFSRSDEEKVRLGLKAYKGRLYFDMRIWFTDKETLKIVPSRKGLCLTIDCLPQMREFLEILESTQKNLPKELTQELGASLKVSQNPPGQACRSDRPKSAVTVEKEKRYERPSETSKPFTRHF